MHATGIGAQSGGWPRIVKCEICGADMALGAAVVRSLEGVEHHFCSVACEKAWEELDQAREKRALLTQTKRNAER